MNYRYLKDINHTEELIELTERWKTSTDSYSVEWEMATTELRRLRKHLTELLDE